MCLIAYCRWSQNGKRYYHDDDDDYGYHYYHHYYNYYLITFVVTFVGAVCHSRHRAKAGQTFYQH